MLFAVAEPLDPGREEARRWAAEELARREYQQARPGFVERTLAWLLDRLADLLGAVPGVRSPAWALGLGILVAVIVAAIFYAVWRSGGPGRLRTARGNDDLFGDAGPLSAAEHRAAAVAAAAEQDWERAVIERFRAIARELEERTVLAPRPGRTAGEVARDAIAVLPRLGEALDGAAHLFDAVRYGGRPATAQTAERLRTVDDAVQAAKVVSV
jgi:hypothetical protein